MSLEIEFSLRNELMFFSHYRFGFTQSAHSCVISLLHRDPIDCLVVSSGIPTQAVDAPRQDASAPGAGLKCAGLLREFYPPKGRETDSASLPICRATNRLFTSFVHHGSNSRHDGQKPDQTRTQEMGKIF